MPEATLSPAQLLDTLNWRYAVKAFDENRKVSDEDWKTLEEATLLAPSSFGLQPYRIIVVTDPDTKAKLREVAWNQGQLTQCSHLVVFAAKKSWSEGDTAHFIDINAQVRGVEATSLDGYAGMINGTVSSRTPEALAEWTKRQAYIALGIFLFSAALLKVDACPIEGFSPEGFDEILGLTDTDYTTTVIAPAGYRSDEDKYGHLPKVRYPYDEIFRHV